MELLLDSLLLFDLFRRITKGTASYYWRLHNAHWALSIQFKLVRRKPFPDLCFSKDPISYLGLFVCGWFNDRRQSILHFFLSQDKRSLLVILDFSPTSLFLLFCESFTMIFLHLQQTKELHLLNSLKFWLGNSLWLQTKSDVWRKRENMWFTFRRTTQRLQERDKESRLQTRM